MVSIKDVAKKAGVSITTVSRALNDHPYVSKATKDKIFQTMQDMNYYPNNVAQQLRSQKSNMIGVIISYITNPFFSSLVDTIEKSVSEHGYHLVVLQTRGNTALEKFYVEMLQKRQLDGLIITNLESATPTVKQLIEEGKIVLCNRYIGDENLPIIRIDEEQASYEGTKLLIDHGHTNIAYCTGHHMDLNDQRYKGFLRAMNEHDLPVAEALFFEKTLGVDGGRQFIRDIVQRKDNRPTAVFTNGDEVAAGIISEARKFSISVPEDLSVLGFDDQPIAALTNPEITTISQPIEKIGELATQTLISNLKEKSSSKHVTLLTKLVLRESVSKCTE